MAWEGFERDGRKGISGDDPIDELSIALARITNGYRAHFDRKPTIDEVLDLMTVVLRMNPSAFIERPEIMADHVAVLGPIQPRSA